MLDTPRLALTEANSNTYREIVRREAQTQSTVRSKDLIFDTIFCAAAYDLLLSPEPWTKGGGALLSVACAFKAAAHASPNDKVYNALQDIATLLQPWGQFGLFLSILNTKSDPMSNAKTGEMLGGLLDIGKGSLEKSETDLIPEIWKWFEEYKDTINELEKKIENLGSAGADATNSGDKTSPHGDWSPGDVGPGRSFDNPRETKPDTTKPGVGEGVSENSAWLDA